MKQGLLYLFTYKVEKIKKLLAQTRERALNSIKDYTMVVSFLNELVFMLIGIVAGWYARKGFNKTIDMFKGVKR